MILGAWQVLVLVGAGSAYLGFIRKGEGAVFALISTTGCFAVATLGSLSIEAQHTTGTEWGIAVLFAMFTAIAVLALPVAITKSGPYAEDDGDDDDRNDPLEQDSSWLDELTGWMT